MVDARGTIGACHMTFLAANGEGKAPVEQPKLMWPETAGLVIRISNGATGLSGSEAAEAGVSGLVGLTEGIEDALSAALATPELRMWAAGSLSGLLHVPDHPCAAGWIIFKDNDWGKAEAQALFDRAVARIKSFRKPVEVVSLPADWGKDVNDAINH
jgi:hypothetical protein